MFYLCFVVAFSPRRCAFIAVTLPMANGCSLDLKIAPSCSGTHTSLKREVSAGNSPTNLKYNLCMSIVCAPLGIRGIIRNPCCRCGGIAIQ